MRHPRTPRLLGLLLMGVAVALTVVSRPTPAPAATAARRALLFCLEDYRPWIALGWQGKNLPSAAEDTRRVRRLLEARGYQVEVVPAARMTWNGVYRALTGLCDRAGRGDDVVVYFSLHGALVPSTMRHRDGRQAPEGMLMLADHLFCECELSALMRKLTSTGAHVTLWLDSCHAAVLAKGSAKVVGMGPVKALLPPPGGVFPTPGGADPKPFAPADLLTPKGGPPLPYVRLAASGGGQPANTVYLNDGRPGETLVSLFTWSVCEALEGGDARTFGELLPAVRARFGRLAQSQYPQVAPESALAEPAFGAAPAPGPIRIAGPAPRALVRRAPGSKLRVAVTKEGDAPDLTPAVNGVPGVAAWQPGDNEEPEVVLRVGRDRDGLSGTLEGPGTGAGWKFRADDRRGLEALAAQRLQAFRFLRFLGLLGNPAGRSALRLTADAPDGRYRLGQTMNLAVRADRDGFLTLLAVVEDGDVVLLYPNAHSAGNRVVRGQTYRIPDRAAGDRFRITAQEPGRDFYVAVITEDPLPLLGQWGGRVPGAKGYLTIPAAEVGAFGEQFRQALETGLRAKRPGIVPDGQLPTGGWSSDSLVLEIESGS